MGNWVGFGWDAEGLLRPFSRLVSPHKAPHARRPVDGKMGGPGCHAEFPHAGSAAVTSRTSMRLRRATLGSPVHFHLESGGKESAHR